MNIHRSIPFHTVLKRHGCFPTKTFLIARNFLSSASPSPSLTLLLPQDSKLRSDGWRQKLRFSPQLHFWALSWYQLALRTPLTPWDTLSPPWLPGKSCALILCLWPFSVSFNGAILNVGFLRTWNVSASSAPGLSKLSVKEQMVSTLAFAGHRVSATSAVLYYISNVSDHRQY